MSNPPGSAPVSATGNHGLAQGAAPGDATAAGPNTQQAPRNEGPGGYIQRFKILQLIGEGGFGSVFEAEQEYPVKRRVALKVIKLGMDTLDVIARFEAERQALAMMDHPHIARVLDAGATDSGRPYFVMDLVKGEPISSYCDRFRLSIVERLQLFGQVCHAVQHAHTKGVIHRDLKPSNVLVGTQEDRPFAKVIDFGIAKATSGRLTDRTLFTEQHQMIGTPQYMSPEQAEGSADIDTRTDIYALGVLLYELLTGTTPFESSSLRSAAYAEIQRIIREVEPPRPSVRLADSGKAIESVASRFRTEPRRLARQLRGELDWIVMKAIEKERARRYETASALAQDVRRYLDGERVLAAPPSFIYRMRKFVRRNRIAVAASLAVSATLLAGIVGFAYQARIAQRRAAELEQVSRFQAGMLRQVDLASAGTLLSADVLERYGQSPSLAALGEAARAARIDAFASLWREVNANDTARTLIDGTILKPAVGAIDREFTGQPIVAATLTQVLSEVYRGIGLYDAALPLQQRALELRRRELGDAHADTLQSVYRMAEILHYQNQLAEAEPLYLEALAGRRTVLGPDHPDTLATMANLGGLLQDQGRPDESEQHTREAMERMRKVLGEEHPETLYAIYQMGVLMRTQRKLDEAERYLREALDKSRRTLGGTHQDTQIAMDGLIGLLIARGNLDAAESVAIERLQASRSSVGEDHPNTLLAMNNLGAILRDQGKLAEAAPYFRLALDKNRHLLGDAHALTLVSTSNLGGLLQAQGRPEEAIALLAPAEAVTRATFKGTTAYRLAKLQLKLGMARTDMGQYREAQASLAEAFAIFSKAPGPRVADRLDTARAIAANYKAMDAAEPGSGHDTKAAEWAAVASRLEADPVAAFPVAGAPPEGR